MLISLLILVNLITDHFKGFIVLYVSSPDYFPFDITRNDVFVRGFK